MRMWVRKNSKMLWLENLKVDKTELSYYLLPSFLSKIQKQGTDIFFTQRFLGIITHYSIAFIERCVHISDSPFKRLHRK